MSALGPLTVLSPLAAAPAPQGRVVLTRKFVEGMGFYARAWPGPVRVVLHPSRGGSTDLDQVDVAATELPFAVEFCAFDSPDLVQRLHGSALVLGGPDYRTPHLVDQCESVGAACVYVTELSLRTRLQIASVEGRGGLRLAKQALWEANQERWTLRALRRAAGVQCNGTPTYRLYRHVSRDALLFFDTRTDQSLFARPEDMRRRAERLRGGAPLTLAFSGRLVSIKGAEQLIDVALRLKQLGFPFRFLIAGDGPDGAVMRERIARERLHEVQMLGVLPFATGLMPLVREEVDVFVACHRQGDPSCTYLETFAAGVPIAGYDNEAFSGLLDMAEVGWSAPLGQPARLAEVIAGLSREEILQRATHALELARDHSVEATFERRAAHLRRIAEHWRNH